MLKLDKEGERGGVRRRGRGKRKTRKDDEVVELYHNIDNEKRRKEMKK